MGFQRGPYEFSTCADLLTLNLRIPLHEPMDLQFQLDGMELWLTSQRTEHSRVGGSAWGERSIPITGHWALLPGLGLDLTLGWDILVRDHQLHYRPGGGLGVLWRGGVAYQGKHGMNLQFANRYTTGILSGGSLWVNAELEFLLMYTWKTS